jgi:hypothetical protein
MKGAGDGMACLEKKIWPSIRRYLRGGGGVDLKTKHLSNAINV